MKRTALSVFALAGTLVLTLLVSSNTVLPHAFAHQTMNFGGINIEVGWADEPSLAGQLNTITVGISNASDDKPVPNAVGQLQATIKKGSETKALDLLPQEQEGLYGAQIIPGQIGQYQLVLKGTVNGQSINGTIPLDDVSDPKQLTFPSTGGSENSQLTSGIIDQVSTAITDLSTQVDAAKASADQAQQAAQNATQSAQSIKASADGAYMFATIAVGIGVAGIAIAVIALSRREKVEGEKIPRY
jgi:outer membrane murein-binding lipoprotein Lpp